jgi:hypothetical protein
MEYLGNRDAIFSKQGPFISWAPKPLDAWAGFEMVIELIAKVGGTDVSVTTCPAIFPMRDLT